MSEQNQGPVQKPRKPTLPPPRTFLVRRTDPDAPLAYPRSQEFSVNAHSVDMAPNGALMFLEYRLVDGDLIPQLPRVFNSWLDYEEVLVVKSRLIS